MWIEVVEGQGTYANTYPIEILETRWKGVIRMSGRSGTSDRPTVMHPLVSRIEFTDDDNETRLAIEHADRIPVATHATEPHPGS